MELIRQRFKSRTAAAAADWLLAAGLALAAAAMVWHYGLRAVAFAGDLIYDGGYKLLWGDLPFVDFFSSQGMLQATLQGLVFAVFGLNYEAFVLHAALANSLFAVIVYWLLRRLGLGPAMSAVYALASAIFAYTPMGYAHPDKHGVLLVLLGIALQIESMGRGRRFAVAAHAVVALTWVLALATKANPIFLGPPLTLALLLLLPNDRKLAAVAGGFLGLLLAAAAALVMDALHPGFIRSAFYYLLELPVYVWQARSGRVSGAFGPLMIFHYSPRSVVLTIGLAMGAIAATGAWLAQGVTRFGAAGRLGSGPLPALAVGLVMLAMALFHGLHADQPQDGLLETLFVAMGALHAALLSALHGRPSRPGAWFAVVLAVVTLMDGLNYTTTFNAMRKAMDQDYALSAIQPPGAIGLSQLERVRWIPVQGNPGELDSLRAAVAMAREVPHGVLLAGITPMVYALAEKPPVPPSLYYYPGHSTPRLGTPEDAKFRRIYRERIQRWQVGHLMATPHHAEILQGQIGDLFCSRGERGGLVLVTLCGGLGEKDLNRLVDALLPVAKDY